MEAEEEAWDFAPLGGDMCSGTLTPFTPEQEVFTKASSLSLGSK